VSGLHLALLAIPMLVLLQALLAYLLAHLLAILAAAVRDVVQILGFFLSVGIYLTPVFFPLSLFPPGWRWALFANPMTALVIAYQQVLLQGQWPDTNLWLVTLGWMLVLSVMLNRLIGRSRDELVDWL
jgi:lipopolysaccharide transport system permease protein